MSNNNYRVPDDGTFQVATAPTAAPSDVASEKALKKELRKTRGQLYELQRELYAHNRFSVLLVFQAMDAAGKDSTIRHVMRGVNPAGCQVFSFKQPSSLELDHDFLWRSAVRLPERGRIGIFNRSYYEEVLVVRVHPEYLDGQNLPGPLDQTTIWEERYHSIREHERHLTANGTRVLKFWLNVSRDEQKNRFLERLRDPSKNWKFSAADLRERALWDQYMEAYQQMLNATSRPEAPWYAIPADNKPFARLVVARIIADTIRDLGCHYPSVPEDEEHNFSALEQQLVNEQE